MKKSIMEVLEERLSEDGLRKLLKLNNPKINEFLAEYILLCDPGKVTVCDDSEEDIEYTRKAALVNREEADLITEGHMIHYDGYYDQARDKKRTKFLLPPGKDLGPEINAVDRRKGLAEIRSIMENIMQGQELFVKFYCLGPTDSEFSIPSVQLTDSAYVAHSEDILYRQGYKEFLRRGKNAKFFKFVHSQGNLEDGGHGLLVSTDIENRRVYMDLENDIIFSSNTQYGGNTLGLKKLAMRLAINRASEEGWLTEHMLVMGVFGPGGRKSYFTGAYPSMCGKTSTAMLKGESIVGDDIAYLRNIEGEARAVNVESGIFGIIDGINSKEDPAQWDMLNRKGEIIFTNQLLTEEGDNYWNGKDGERPDEGLNHSGRWWEGKKDDDGKEITPSHKNARFTLRLDMLDTMDPKLHDPEGVKVDGVIYGGRDSDTSVPLEEAFDWVHGIITKGAALESETTAATLGKEGVRVFNPMSNLDFLSIPIGRYVDINLDFGKGLAKPPTVFGVNYFLRGENGDFLNSKNDKRIWLKWMELRVNGEVGAIRTPTGQIPEYGDLKRLFEEVLDKRYTREDYVGQFSVRVSGHLSKIDRITRVYRERVNDTPGIVFEVLGEQRERLKRALENHGELISPFDLR